MGDGIRDSMAEQSTSASTVSSGTTNGASSGKARSSSSSSSTLKEKLHHIGEKLALVPPTDKELADRLEDARADGDIERENKLLMQRTAAGQNAATDPDE